MAKQLSISTRINEDLHNWIREDAESSEITMSEWLNLAISSFIEDDTEDLTFDDLDEMSFDELVDIVHEYELDLDPDDHEGGLFMSAREKLRNAIADELDITEEPEEEFQE